jgi:hypothetical protein
VESSTNATIVYGSAVVEDVHTLSRHCPHTRAHWHYHLHTAHRETTIQRVEDTDPPDVQHPPDQPHSLHSHHRNLATLHRSHAI